MNPKHPELPYQEQVIFTLEPMPAFREADEPAQENDVVNIFLDERGRLLAAAFGFRNLGFYIGLVMKFGSPYGFGKVMHVVNGTAFVYFAQYPTGEVDSSQDTGVILANGN